MYINLKFHLFLYFYLLKNKDKYSYNFISIRINNGEVLEDLE
ncbi:hypothetical protein YN1HA_6990 [Sulfurisphaera ohwakuensis]